MSASASRFASHLELTKSSRTALALVHTTMANAPASPASANVCARRQGEDTPSPCNPVVGPGAAARAHPKRRCLTC
eukprot:364556-Chlamydomonas_euryale.AAC.24